MFDRALVIYSPVAECLGTLWRSQSVPKHSATGFDQRSDGVRVKITKIETIRLGEHPRLIWVQVHTDNGLVGLGETFYVPGAVAAVVHDVAAPLLLGEDPLDIERHWHALFHITNYYGYAGAEMRAISALDIALWDIAG